MATYFVFGNAPRIDDLLDFTDKGEISSYRVTIEDSDHKLRHFILNINGHKVGIQIDNSGIVTAIYEIEEDYDGVKLLGMVVEKWSEENSDEEDELAITVVDDEMSLYLSYV